MPASGSCPSTCRATSRMRLRVSFMARARAAPVSTDQSLHAHVQWPTLHSYVQCTSLCNGLLLRPTTPRGPDPMNAPTPAPSTLVRPFAVAIPDAEIDDLRMRLA